MEKIDVIEIFPTPIGIFQYDKHDYVEKQIEIYLSKNKPTHRGVSDRLFHYENDKGNTILDNYIFKDLKKWILECSSLYSREVLGFNTDEMIVTDSWINVAKKGAYQMPHLHVNSFLSATYYINRNNNHSPILFRNPKNVEYNGNKPILLMNIKKNTKFNSDVRIEPKNGTLVIWESFVVHGYEENPSDGRIAMSLNIMPRNITNGVYGYEILPKTRK